jgi:hypothetical protein
MLQILPTHGDDKTGELGVVATKALWFDLLNPTSAEVTSVEKTVGGTLPTLGALSEIEASSRLRNDRGVLYMSTPSAARPPEGAQTTPPLGFVLSTERLITVRFMPLPAFDAVAGKFASSQDAPKSSLEVFTLLCEEIVDRVADILEHRAITRLAGQPEKEAACPSRRRTFAAFDRSDLHTANVPDANALGMGREKVVCPAEYVAHSGTHIRASYLRCLIGGFAPTHK